jgi:hypothetical protein
MTNVRDTSLKALRENKIKLGFSQKEVFRVILDFGPCHDHFILQFLRDKNAAIAKVRKVHFWENSNICGRRNQLINKGIIIDRGSFYGWWEGRIVKYHFWSVWNDDRPIPEGWHERIEDVFGYKGHKSTRRKAMATTLF